MKKKIIIIVSILAALALSAGIYLSQLKQTTPETIIQQNNTPRVKPQLAIIKKIPHEAVSISSNKWVENEIKIIHAKANNLDTKALRVSLTAYLKAKQKGIINEPMITIVDYSKPSDQRRLWVIDLRTNKILFNTWVAHGKNSGAAQSTSFSNNPRSLKSSMGVFVTDSTYSGHNGYSLRVKGLEPHINDNAYSRSIVFHGAAYAHASVAKARGMLGRSWGCFAVGRDTIKPLIDTIKRNTLVVAYYPDQHWLSTSRFLR